MLVIKVDEILEGVDVTERDGSFRVEPLPVVERVAVVAQNRRPAQQRACLAEWHRDTARQHFCFRLRHLVDVRGGEKAQAKVVEAKFRDTLLRRLVSGPFRDAQAFDVAAKQPVLQKARQVAANLVEHGEFGVGRKRFHWIRFGKKSAAGKNRFHRFQYKL